MSSKVFGAPLPRPPKPALLLIDFMKGYFADGGPFLLPRTNVILTTQRLLETARANDVSVIHTRVVYDTPEQAGRFGVKVPGLRMLTRESPWSDFVDELRPAGNELVVEKHFASAFFETPLREEFRALDVRTIVICGVSTSGCVRASAVDAIQHGYTPLVVKGGVADRSVSVQEASLFDIDAKYGDVVDAEEASRLLRPLPHP